MNNLNFKINTGFTYIYNKFIDEYMVESPVYSMVYIYALRLACQGLSADNKYIADKLNIFESDVVKAWKFWQNKGIVNISNDIVEFVDLNEEKKEIAAAKDIFYNPSDVRNLAKNDKNIDQLILTVEKILGKNLSPNNVNIIVNMYDKLGLPYEVIITLVQFYSDKNLSYIEKVAINWSEKGIITIEQAEAELNSYSVYSKIIKFFGVNNRNYTENEKKFMSVWVNEYKFPLDIIKIACERTIANTGKVSLSYANKILLNWHGKGIKTIEDIARLDEKPKTKSQQTTMTKPIKNVFNDYDQKIYTEDEIKEILRRKANS